MSDILKRLEHFIAEAFDPESADYDYATAERAGMRRDRRGHMGSVAPVPGEPDVYQLLKGRQHPTWDKGVAAENMRGSAVVKRADGRYYSEPFAPGGGYADGGLTKRSIQAIARSLQKLPADEAARQARGREHFPVEAFHSTRADFDEFGVGDIGYHFGTAEQANKRLRATAKEAADPYGEHVMPVRLNIRNPLQMNDVGEWNDPFVVAKNLHNKPELSRVRQELIDILDEAREVRGQFESIDDWKASPEAAQMLNSMREIVRSQGYDGIRYRNMVENAYGEQAGLTPRAEDLVRRLEAQSRDVTKRVVSRREQLPEGNVTEDQVQRWLNSSEPQPTDRERARLETIRDRINRVRASGTNDPHSYIVFEPSQVRSRHAQFDPNRLSEGNLLAGLGAGGAGMVLMQPEETPGFADGGTPAQPRRLTPDEARRELPADTLERLRRTYRTPGTAFSSQNFRDASAVVNVNPDSRPRYADGGLTKRLFRMFHVSPRRFERFDDAKIGRGLGASYDTPEAGWGHYLGPQHNAEEWANYLREKGHNKIFLYDVEIDAPRSSLAEWQRPLSEQRSVLQRLNQRISDRDTKAGLREMAQDEYMTLYGELTQPTYFSRNLQKALGSQKPATSEKEVSALLDQLGIPGHFTPRRDREADAVIYSGDRLKIRDTTRFAEGGLARRGFRNISEIIDDMTRRVRRFDDLPRSDFDVQVAMPPSADVPGWHITSDLPGILQTGAMTNRNVGDNNIQGWVPERVGGAYFYSHPALARAQRERMSEAVGDDILREMPILRAQLRKGNRLVSDEDVALDVPWEESYRQGSFATTRPVLLNQIDRIYSPDPDFTKDVIRDYLRKDRPRFAEGGSVEDEDPVPTWTPEQIRSMTHTTPQQHGVRTIPDYLRSMRDIAAEHYVDQATGLATNPLGTISRNVRTASELALPVASAYKLADVATGAPAATAPDAFDVAGDVGTLAGYGAGRQALRALGSAATRAAPAAAASVPFVAFPQDAEAGGKSDIFRLAREAVDARLPSGTFSPAARAIESAPQDMTGAQWRNYLRNRNVDVSGQRFPVRPDELEFTGLDALLAQNEGAKVGRGDLLDFLGRAPNSNARPLTPSEYDDLLYLQANRNNLEQSGLDRLASLERRESLNPISPAQRELQQLEEKLSNISREETAALIAGDFQTSERLSAESRQINETIRSLREQLRASNSTSVPRNATYPREDVLGAAERRLTAGGTQYDSYQLPGPRENYEESLTRMPGLEYNAPHFGTIGRDLVSHSRMSARPVIEPDGTQARGVHIDEIQSDLHQKARDEGGYREAGAGSRRDELIRQRQAFETEVAVFDDTNNRVFRAVQQLMREPPSPERDRQLRILRDQRREAFNAREELLRQIREIDQALPTAERSPSNLPPRAPYQDRYHEVEFNKALRRAVDEDADYVTWTTGEQQAQRWNQQIKGNVKRLELIADHENNGLRVFDAAGNTRFFAARQYTKPNGEIGTGYRLPERGEVVPLQELLGNSLAKKLEKDGMLEGDNLSLGGGGFRNFYDGTINKFAESWARRFPGAEVGQRAVPGAASTDTRTRPSVIAQRAREHFGIDEDLQDPLYDYARTVGVTNGQVNPQKRANLVIHMQNLGLTESRAEELLQHIEKQMLVPAQPQRVHSLRLTPEMKAWIKANGTPIMSVAGAGAAVGANSETLQRIEELLGEHQ